MIEAHAPGKLVLCGEYAVLDGAPALAVAMPVRARACIASSAAESMLTVTGEGSWGFVWERGLPRWREPPPRGLGRLLEAVAATLMAEGRTLSAPLIIELDTRAFQQRGRDGHMQKLGLGSSAALTVALTAGLLAGLGDAEPSRASVESSARRAHHHFQDGAGSGIDIAAAVHGGVVLLDGAQGVVRALGWPAGLQWLAVWTGESASTPALLARFAAFHRRDAAACARHLAGLAVQAARVAAAWEQDATAELLTGLADYDVALRAFDGAAGIGIVTPVHERLALRARESGVIYKTSGAGGGDFGIAFAASQAPIARFAAACAAEGFLTLPGDVGAGGVVIRSAATGDDYTCFTAGA